MSSLQLLSDDETRARCTSHHCPNCGIDDHVTVERVVVGFVAVTRCHCRACGHSWDPESETAEA